MTDTILYILDYPGAMKSAVYGASEVIGVANKFLDNNLQIFTKVVEVESTLPRKRYPQEIIFIPPAIDTKYIYNPDKKVLKWLEKRFLTGSIVTSSCAGAFILAKSQIISNEIITTHWGLEEKIRELYPHITVDTNHIIKDEGHIITSGGMLSWQDLVFHIIRRFTTKDILNKLSRYLVIDIPNREQRNYIIFKPITNHKNKKINIVQEYIHYNFSTEIKVSNLSHMVNLGERTFLRQFKQATKKTPLDYIQNIRIREAQKLLESTDLSTEEVCYKVGYNDFSAFKKVFIRIIGLSPSKFRKLWRRE